MGTKNNLIIFLLFILITKQATANNDYYIKEVVVDGIGMNYDDYRLFFKGKTIVDSIFWDSYDEENRKIVVYESDSLYIHMSSSDTIQLYSKYIEILSSRHEIKLHNMVFRVGMNVEVIDSVFPDIRIKKRYQEYIGKEKQYFSRPAYFGKPMMLETPHMEVPSYPCGGLKFQLLEGKVISILVDFRTDGDF